MYIMFHIMHVVFDEINSKARNFKCAVSCFFFSLSPSLCIQIPSIAIYNGEGCIHYGCFSLNIWKSIDRTAETNHRVHEDYRYGVYITIYHFIINIRMEVTFKRLLLLLCISWGGFLVTLTSFIMETWKAECQVFIIFVQYTKFDNHLSMNWQVGLWVYYYYYFIHHFSVWLVIDVSVCVNSRKMGKNMKNDRSGYMNECWAGFVQSQFQLILSKKAQTFTCTWLKFATFSKITDRFSIDILELWHGTKWYNKIFKRGNTTV